MAESQGPQGRPEPGKEVPSPTAASSNNDGPSAAPQGRPTRPPLAQPAPPSPDHPVGSVWLTEIHEVKSQLDTLITAQVAANLLLGVVAAVALYYAFRFAPKVGA